MADDLRALHAAIAGEPTNQQIDELWDEVASYFHLYDEARELVREASRSKGLFARHCPAYATP